MALKDRFSFRPRGLGPVVAPNGGDAGQGKNTVIHHKSRGTTVLHSYGRSDAASWYDNIYPENTVQLPGATGDSTAGDMATKDDMLTWEAEKASDDDFPLDHSTYPDQTSDPSRPRTYIAGYDREGQRLRVGFRDGAVYEYGNFTQEQYNELTSTWSVGKWMNNNLDMRPGGEGVKVS
jgi:hypothetical protein